MRRARLRLLALLLLIGAVVSAAAPECQCPSAPAAASVSSHACCAATLALRRSDHDCCPAGRSALGPATTVSVAPLPARTADAGDPSPVPALPTVVAAHVPISPSPPAVCLRI